MKNSSIEWTDHTFSPWLGCTKVSPACDHCYAEALMDTRMHRVTWGAGQPRKRTSAANWREPQKWNRECERTGTRARVFCASLADVFDNEVPAEWRRDLFNLILSTPHLTWLLLTKRIGNWKARMNCALGSSRLPERWLNGHPPPNVWLGATICNQAEADRDVPKLLAAPAAKRFLSIEPMLGPVDLMPMFEHRADAYNDTGVDWIICGGESGPHARPMHPDWPRSLRDQCAAAGVPFLFKQWGEWRPPCHGAANCFFPPGDPLVRTDDSVHKTMLRVGKHSAGRLLDGVEHNGVPA